MACTCRRSPVSPYWRPWTENRPETFIHEYAHAVCQDQLTKQERAEYRNIWREQYGAESLIMDYAYSSPEEAFAESFAWYYLHNSDLMLADFESWHFIDRAEYNRQ